MNEWFIFSHLNSYNIYADTRFADTDYKTTHLLCAYAIELLLYMYLPWYPHLAAGSSIVEKKEVEWL